MPWFVLHMDLIDVWKPSFKHVISSHTWNNFSIRWCKEGLDFKNSSNSSLTISQWSSQPFVLSRVTSTMHPSMLSEKT
jgi:hypothetical protein